MDEQQCELFDDHYESEFDDEDDREDARNAPTTVNSVEEFGPEHDEWKYFQDETQESFYPIVGGSKEQPY